MAFKTALFIGFEETNLLEATPGGPSLTSASFWLKPPNVFHPSAIASGNSGTIGYMTLALGRTASQSSPSENNTSLGNGPTVSRSSFLASGGGAQFAVDRDYWMGVNANELYACFDIRVSDILVTSASMPTSGNPLTDIFRWGDVSVTVSSFQLDAISSMGYAHRFSLRNAGVEVASVNTPPQLWSNWHAIRIRIKLDAVSGLIECTVNGHAQSATYDGQNTVTSMSVSDARWIYAGPPVYDDGTNLKTGFLDNWWLGSLGFPDGRPRGEHIYFDAAKESSSGWTSSASLSLSLTFYPWNNLSVDEAIGVGIGSEAVLGLNTLTATDCLPELIGYVFVPARVANRHSVVRRSLSAGVVLDGNKTFGARMGSFVPPYDPPSNVPAVTRMDGVWDAVWEQGGGLGPFPFSRLASAIIKVG